MKKLILMTGLLTASLIASAQQVVSGTVVDKDGNPIPGAKVEIVGNTETCITELDGTYNIETTDRAKRVRVKYAGMQTTVKRIKPDMVVQLSQTNWWNAKPDKYRWFVSLQGAFPESGASNPSFGLMAGCVKHIGFYVKGVYKSEKSVDETYDSWSSDYILTTGEKANSFSAATGGFIVRLGCPIHLYGGAGYAERQVAWKKVSGSYIRESSYCSVVAEAGLMMKLGHIVLNGGGMYVLDGDHIVGSFGIGYSF